MEEKQKCKECWNCGNFAAYYTKGFCYFDKTKQGFCSKHCEIKGKHDSCEFWRKDIRIRGLRQAIAKKALTDLLINLSTISQILQEEQEDKNEQS